MFGCYDTKNEGVMTGPIGDSFCLPRANLFGKDTGISGVVQMGFWICGISLTGIMEGGPWGDKGLRFRAVVESVSSWSL
jgi:hypothetical protein